jgi:hypothetical protein
MQMRIIGAMETEGTLGVIVRAEGASPIRLYVFGAVLHVPRMFAEDGSVRDLLEKLQPVKPLQFSEITSLRVLVHIPRSSKVYLTHADVPSGEKNCVYQRVSLARVPPDAALSEWARRFVVFANEARACGDNPTNLVGGFPILSIR